MLDDQEAETTIMTTLTSHINIFHQPSRQRTRTSSCKLKPAMKPALYNGSITVHSLSQPCIGLARVTNGVTSAKSTYRTILPALEIMSLVNDTRIMLLRSLLICEKKKLQRRRNKRKRSAPFCKLKHSTLEQLTIRRTLFSFLCLDNTTIGLHYNSTSGYYYNQSNGFYYDTNAGFYYSDSIGKWVTQEEAYVNLQFLSNAGYKKTILKKPASTSGAGSATENKGADKAQNGPPPGPVVSSSLNPKRSVKGAPSSIAVGKRKRDEKPRAISVEEAAALKAREAARKRVQERERETIAWPLPAATVWLL
ncbi:hypothetical protein ACFX2I_003191 [Malus domestica]